MHRTRLLYFGTGYGAGAVVCNPVVMQQGKQKQIKQNLLPPPLPASLSPPNQQKLSLLSTLHLHFPLHAFLGPEQRRLHLALLERCDVVVGWRDVLCGCIPYPRLASWNRNGWGEG
jgi:hypothetical protein